MKLRFVFVLILMFGAIYLISSCSKDTPSESLRWPPDTITVVYVGGNVYELSAGAKLSKVRMNAAFLWPRLPDSAAMRGDVAMKIPVPWPPDTIFLPTRVTLTEIKDVDSLR